MHSFLLAVSIRPDPVPAESAAADHAADAASDVEDGHWRPITARGQGLQHQYGEFLLLHSCMMTYDNYSVNKVQSLLSDILGARPFIFVIYDIFIS